MATLTNVPQSFVWQTFSQWQNSAVIFPARPDSQAITQTELVLYLGLKGRPEQLIGAHRDFEGELAAITRRYDAQMLFN